MYPHNGVWIDTIYWVILDTFLPFPWTPFHSQMTFPCSPSPWTHSCSQQGRSSQRSSKKHETYNYDFSKREKIKLWLLSEDTLDELGDPRYQQRHAVSDLACEPGTREQGMAHFEDCKFFLRGTCVNGKKRVFFQIRAAFYCPRKILWSIWVMIWPAAATAAVSLARLPQLHTASCICMNRKLPHPNHYQLYSVLRMATVPCAVGGVPA